MKRAIFLDRDGTLIENGEGYRHKKEDLRFLPGVVEGLRDLESKYLLFIITNQSGIARGYYTEKEFFVYNNELLRQLGQANINIIETYFCPHHPNSLCQCRKPNPFFILEAAKKYSLDLSESWMIGDAYSDIEAANAAGVKGILIADQKSNLRVATVKDFSSAVAIINSYE